MRKNIVLLFLCLLAVTGLRAQGSGGLHSKGLVSNHSVSLNLIGLDYAYEQHLGGNFTIIGRAGLSSAMGWSNGEYLYTINPIIGAEPRFYYNVGRRLALGKCIDCNSANFVSLEYRYLFQSIVSNGVELTYPVALSPTWGLRRVWNGRWLFEFNTGLNFYWSQDMGWAWGPRLGLKFGVAF